MIITALLKGLGLEFGKEFTIEGENYKFTNEGLVDDLGIPCNNVLWDILQGRVTITPSLIMKEGDEYFYVNHLGEVSSVEYTGDAIDAGLICSGNFFRTKKEAEGNRFVTLDKIEEVLRQPNKYLGKL